jgi:hypothetical protein
METVARPARRRSGVGATDIERTRTLETTGPEILKSKSKLRRDFNQQISRYPLRAQSLSRFKFEFSLGFGTWPERLLEFPAMLFRTDCGQQNDREKNETFHHRHSQGVIGISIRVSKVVR